jgi:hypothetical protein
VKETLKFAQWHNKATLLPCATAAGENATAKHVLEYSPLNERDGNFFSFACEKFHVLVKFFYFSFPS